MWCGWSWEDAGLRASLHEHSVSRAPPAMTTRSSSLFSSPPHLPQTEDSCEPRGAPPQDPPRAVVLCMCVCLCTPNAGCWRVGNLSTTEARCLLHHTACPVSTAQASEPPGRPGLQEDSAATLRDWGALYSRAFPEGSGPALPPDQAAWGDVSDPQGGLRRCSPPSGSVSPCFRL